MQRSLYWPLSCFFFQAPQRNPRLRVPELSGEAVERVRHVADGKVPELCQQVASLDGSFLQYVERQNIEMQIVDI
jgi:hypothetical protein